MAIVKANTCLRLTQTLNMSIPLKPFFFFASPNTCISWFSSLTLQKISDSLWLSKYSTLITLFNSTLCHRVAVQLYMTRLFIFTRIASTSNPVTLQGDLVKDENIVNGTLCHHFKQPSIWLPALHHQKTHFISLTRKSLAMIPATRMKTMISNARPRRKTSCVTERTFPTVVVEDLFCSGICASWYVLSSSALSQLDAVVLACAQFWFESGGLRENL